MRIPNRIQECSIMGISIACISMKRFLSILDNRLEELSGNYICSTSAFTIIAAQKSKEYKLSQVDAFMRLPNDSITTLIAKFRGYPFVEKLHSKDIMEQIFLRSATKGYRHYFYGQSEEILTRLYENLHKKYPGINIVGMKSSKNEVGAERLISKDIEDINLTRPDFVWVVLNKPAQELWMYKNQESIQGLMIGIKNTDLNPYLKK